MPSPWHDAVIKMVRGDPDVAAQILRVCAGVDIGHGLQARLESPSFNDRPSTDFLADLAITEGPVTDPVHGTIVEAQRTKVSGRREQFARYAAAFWLLIRCPVDVLVICPDQRVADWYSEPVATTLPGYVFRARSVGPKQVPAIIDPGQVAANPSLGVLSVAMHGRDRAVAEAFTAAVQRMHRRDGPEYCEYAYSMADKLIRKMLEKLMTSATWPVYTPFAKEHFGRGKEEGKEEGKVERAVNDVLLVLETRGLGVTAKERTRITSCRDVVRLEVWLTRAVTAQRAADIFG